MNREAEEAASRILDTAIEYLDSHNDSFRFKVDNARVTKKFLDKDLNRHFRNSGYNISISFDGQLEIKKT